MQQQRVRISDIAEELGLSTATISNVIHGKTKKVSDETVKRVQSLQKLHELKENKTSETTIKLPVRLIERASTGKITEQIQLWRDFTRNRDRHFS